MNTEDMLPFDDLNFEGNSFGDLELDLDESPVLRALFDSAGPEKVLKMAMAEVAAAVAKRGAVTGNHGAAKATSIRIPTYILAAYKAWGREHGVPYQTLMVRDLRSASGARQAAKALPLPISKH